ncbi:glycosyltransferase family 25 protein [Arcobacter sp.]|uniref:glycosyltransferase family 25 protein n=1 Tax=unclassified Arcobacter TaxID=2593671 RepID=UPI003B0022AB
MKTFIINLEKDIEKKKVINNICEKHALNYEFICAIYGFNLEESYIKSITNKNGSISQINRELSKGEIGCTLSHMIIYKRIIDDNLPYALILEDDAFFDDKLVTFINTFNNFKEDWDCILLGYYIGSDHKNFTISFDKKIYSKNFAYIMTSQLLSGTHGYLISNQGAKKLLEYNKEITLPIDSYTGDSNLIKQFCIYPPIIHINDQFDINTELEQDRKRLRALYKNLEIVKNLHNQIKGINKCFKIIIYGYGTIGKLLYERIKDKDEIYKIIDSNFNLDELNKNENILFINTILSKNESIKITNKLKSLFLNSKIISVME